MLVTESVPTVAKIKQYVDWDNFSNEQKWIVYVIAEKKLFVEECIYGLATNQE